MDAVTGGARVDLACDAVCDLDSRAPSEGTLPPRARLDTDAARISLNGMWRFRLAAGIRQAPDDGWQTGETEGFVDLPVPSHWPLHGHGAPSYTNIAYPFPLDPPHAPDANPVGDHLCVFEADDRFTDGAALRFDGVDSCGIVWLNGTRLGVTRGSRLCQEFDVTGVLRAGRNVLAVRVAAFSGGSYLEDQDMWWLPGVFRDVTVIARPAGGIDDVFVHAGYDAATGDGILRVEASRAGVAVPANVRVPSLGIACDAGVETRVPGVRPWSAEDPALYDATVATGTEAVAVRIGFRTIDIHDGVLRVNGRAVKLRGVNRHEHDPERGRVISRERLEHELRLMKQHNINAVRTSHYPPHPDFLDLTDEFGLYVVLECDLETHGFEKDDWRDNPADDPKWHDALLDRIVRTVERDKNRASVILWSLGNESGTGRNLAAMSRWVKRRDPSRPIHYESDHDCAYVDVASRMYLPPDLVEMIGRHEEPALEDTALDAHRRGLPFLLCEYAHAMGNGPGGLTEYQDAFDAHPRLAGGFVWEWIEHGIARTDAAGRRFFAYGGDFGEELHDGNFVTDGLVDADLNPRPGLADLARVYAPVRIEVAEDGRAVTVRSRYDTGDTGHLRFEATARHDGHVVAVHPVSVPYLAPGELCTLALPEWPSATDVTVRATLADDGAWADAGHEVAWGQAVLDDGVPTTAAVVPGVPVAVVIEPQTISLGPAVFSRSTGNPLALGSLPIASFRADFWRAPTDNDCGAEEFAWGWEPVAHYWERTGSDRLHTRLIAMTVEPDGRGGEVLRVCTRIAAADSRDGILVEHLWRADGSRIELTTAVRPRGTWAGPWARIGLEIVVDAIPGEVAWIGHGPGQAYPDTGQAARFGRYRMPAEAMDVRYVRPQESGARAGVVRADVGTAAGTLTVEGQPFALTVRGYSQRALAAASHQTDLVPDGRTHVSLDHARRGVGTAACGPGVLPAYELMPCEAVFTVRFAVH